MAEALLNAEDAYPADAAENVEEEEEVDPLLKPTVLVAGPGVIVVEGVPGDHPVVPWPKNLMKRIELDEGKEADYWARTRGMNRHERGKVTSPIHRTPIVTSGAPLPVPTERLAKITSPLSKSPIYDPNLQLSPDRKNRYTIVPEPSTPPKAVQEFDFHVEEDYEIKELLFHYKLFHAIYGDYLCKDGVVALSFSEVQKYMSCLTVAEQDLKEKIQNYCKVETECSSNVDFSFHMCRVFRRYRKFIGICLLLGSRPMTTGSITEFYSTLNSKINIHLQQNYTRIVDAPQYMRMEPHEQTAYRVESVIHLVMNYLAMRYESFKKSR